MTQPHFHSPSPRKPPSRAWPFRSDCHRGHFGPLQPRSPTVRRAVRRLVCAHTPLQVLVLSPRHWQAGVALCTSRQAHRPRWRCWCCHPDTGTCCTLWSCLLSMTHMCRSGCCRVLPVLCARTRMNTHTQTSRAVSDYHAHTRTVVTRPVVTCSVSSCHMHTHTHHSHCLCLSHTQACP